MTLAELRLIESVVLKKSQDPLIDKLKVEFILNREIRLKLFDPNENVRKER